MAVRNPPTIVGLLLLLLLLLCAPYLSACDDDAECPVEPSPIVSGSPLFDAGECGQLPFATRGVVHAPVAVCRTGDGLFRPCDEAFVRSCIDGGAYFSPVPGGDFSLSSNPICAAGSELAPECTRNFEEACWREGGVYACSDQNCLMGYCSIPQGILHCVDLDGFEACYCSDIKACISADKICKNFTCTKWRAIARQSPTVPLCFATAHVRYRLLTPQESRQS